MPTLDMIDIIAILWIALCGSVLVYVVHRLTGARPPQVMVQGMPEPPASLIAVAEKAIARLTTGPRAEWVLHASALTRQAVPVSMCVITNTHDHTDETTAPAGMVLLPIDEVYGITDDPQRALEWVTVSADCTEDWLDMHIPTQRRALTKPPPVWRRSSGGDGWVWSVQQDIAHPIVPATSLTQHAYVPSEGRTLCGVVDSVSTVFVPESDPAGPRCVICDQRAAMLRAMNEEFPAPIASSASDAEVDAERIATAITASSDAGVQALPFIGPENLRHLRAWCERTMMAAERRRKSSEG